MCTENTKAPTVDMPLLLENERADDLQYKGLRIIQASDSFRFGTDSVLLAGFANAKSSDSCIDLGSGSGVLAILLNARTGCRVTAVESDAAQCSRLERSILLNASANRIRGEAVEFDNCENRGAGEYNGIRVVNLDYIKNTAALGIGSFDAAICNPPYFRNNCGGIPANGSATHELTADIAHICNAAAALLKFGGKLFICFPCSRLAEAFYVLCASALEPKRLRLVCSTPSKPPYLSLIEAKKGAKHGLIVERPLVIHTDTGDYTDELKEIYHVK